MVKMRNGNQGGSVEEKTVQIDRRYFAGRKELKWDKRRVLNLFPSQYTAIKESTSQTGETVSEHLRNCASSIISSPPKIYDIINADQYYRDEKGEKRSRQVMILMNETMINELEGICRSLREKNNDRISINDLFVTHLYEEEYDIAVGEEAYREYLAEGKKSKPIEDLWSEPTLPAKIVKNENKGKQVRLNLCLPSDIKKYLDIRAAEETIAKERKVSLTEYLCTLIREDMKKQG